jgi:hypothetical protein
VLLSLLQVLETQEDVLQLLPHTLRLLHSGLAAVNQGVLQSGSLVQSLTVAVHSAIVGGAVAVSALAPLQQLLWMLEAPPEKVLQSPLRQPRVDCFCHMHCFCGMCCTQILDPTYCLYVS